MTDNPSPDDKSTLIAQQNDLLRRGIKGHRIPGRIHATRSVVNSPNFNQLIDSVRAFSDFKEENDPWKEHDRATIGDIYFKIDYYENDELQYGSEDASDLDKTYRVMTIAHNDEW